MVNLAQRKCSFRPKLQNKKKFFGKNLYLENSCELHSTLKMIPKKSFTTYLNFFFSTFFQGSTPILQRLDSKKVFFFCVPPSRRVGGQGPPGGSPGRPGGVRRASRGFLEAERLLRRQRLPPGREFWGALGAVLGPWGLNAGCWSFGAPGAQKGFLEGP